VGILNALGQGVDQPAGYPVDPQYASLTDLTHLTAYPAAGFSQPNQAIPPQSTSSGLTMSQMLDQYNTPWLSSSTFQTYSRAESGHNCMLGSFQIPTGGFQMESSSALPPEQIAAWQAAWLSQPLIASSHAFQG
jgi:hypothetical protein